MFFYFSCFHLNGSFLVCIFYDQQGQKLVAISFARMYIFFPHFRYVFVLPLLLCTFFLFSLLLHTLLFSSLPPGLLVCPWPCPLHACYASSLITQYPWWIGFWADNLFFCFMRSYELFFPFVRGPLMSMRYLGNDLAMALNFSLILCFPFIIFLLP